MSVNNALRADHVDTISHMYHSHINFRHACPLILPTHVTYSHFFTHNFACITHVIKDVYIEIFCIIARHIALILSEFINSFQGVKKFQALIR